MDTLLDLGGRRLPALPPRRPDGDDRRLPRAPARAERRRRRARPRGAALRRARGSRRWTSSSRAASRTSATSRWGWPGRASSAAALEVGYLPDQFGHVGQMPQILRHGGHRPSRGVARRARRRSIATAFRWESPDGSEVLTEYMAFGYFNRRRRSTERARPEELAEALGARRRAACGRSLVERPRSLVMVGYDHAGPDATLPDRLAAAAAAAAGVRRPDRRARRPPRGRHRPDGASRSWPGELRSSARAHLLPNVYSARVHQKRERGRVEALVERYAEPLAALVPGFAWPRGRARPGVDAAAVERRARLGRAGARTTRWRVDVDARFAEARAIARGHRRRARSRRSARPGRRPGVLRFNPSPFERDGVPGLGWRSIGGRAEPPSEPSTLASSRGRVDRRRRRSRSRLLDEPDVGDLYNFCSAGAGPGAVRARRVEVDGDEVERAWRRARGPDARHAPRGRAVPPPRRARSTTSAPDHRLRLHVALAAAATGSLAGVALRARRAAARRRGRATSRSPRRPGRRATSCVAAGAAACFTRASSSTRWPRARSSPSRSSAACGRISASASRPVRGAAGPADADARGADARRDGVLASASGPRAERSCRAAVRVGAVRAAARRRAGIGRRLLPSAGSLLDSLGEARSSRTSAAGTAPSRFGCGTRCRTPSRGRHPHGSSASAPRRSRRRAVASPGFGPGQCRPGHQHPVGHPESSEA